MPRKPRPCGRLIQNTTHGRVDMCGLESGHDKSLTPTPHKGQYRGMVWDEFINPRTGRRQNNIIDQGEAFEDERLEGGVPVTEIRRHKLDIPTQRQPSKPRTRKRAS